MSENCNHNCSSCASNCEDRKKPQSFIVEPNPNSTIRKVIGVVSGKGGVGKSLITSLLASEMQKKGYRTGVLDADITGPSIPKVFGITGKADDCEDGLIPSISKNGVQVMSVNLLLENESDPVIWRGPVIAGVVKQFWTDVIWTDVDCLFVDMPPGTGDVPLTVFQSIPLDGIIVVTSPQELVGMIVEKAVKMAEKMNIPVLGIVENMSYFVCSNCNEKHYIFGDSKIDDLAKAYDIDMVAKIPMNPEIAANCDAGRIEDIDGTWVKDIIEKIVNP